MALLTLALLTVAILTMALLTMALLTTQVREQRAQDLRHLGRARLRLLRQLAPLRGQASAPLPARGTPRARPNPDPNPDPNSKPHPHPSPNPNQVSLVLAATAIYALQPCPGLDAPGRAADDQTALETALPLIKEERGADTQAERQAHGEVETPAATAAPKDTRR